MVSPTIPATTRAAAIDRFGPPAVLTLPIPRAGLRHVLGRIVLEVRRET
jgi:hypothetical protein